jgi:hypothetical protein
MLAKAGHGRAAEELARQFSLSQGQAQAALEALLPAFSQGLKRNAADPFGVGAFLSALSTGRHAEYYANPQSAFSPSGIDEGNGILGHLFGSPEVSRAVAAQAAAATGIAQQTLQSMLPALAAMIMGGLFQQTTGRAPGTPANPLQEMMERMMAGGPAAPREAPRPGADGTGNPFLDHFTRMFEDMASAGRPREEEPPKTPSGRPRNTYDDLFGQMFETGRRTSEDYRKSMESVFDRFLNNTNKRQG